MDWFSDIDFVMDEYGFWVVYVFLVFNGNIMISKIDEDNFMILEIWIMLIFKWIVGNIFMICGVLYVMEFYIKLLMFIKYVYNI